MLNTLYDAAQAANATIPRPPALNLAEITEDEAQALRDFFDADGAARGARDAYATALVMFLDDAFKMLTTFYERIPGVGRALTVRVEGIDVPKIVRDAATSIHVGGRQDT